jgi:hypothetical protein
MNCESEVETFEFTQEQSDEFSSIAHDFLLKHFSGKKLPVNIEIEVKFIPKINSNEIKNFNSVIYGCNQGKPQSPFCDDGEKWG